MYSNCLVPFASLLSLLSPSVLSQIPHDGSTCGAAMQEFFSVHSGGQAVPSFCHNIQSWFVRNASYRINFTQSMVDDVCGSAICLTFLKTILPQCAGFAKKEIACLDSPAIMFTNLLCSAADNGTTQCYASLLNKGVIDTQNANSSNLLMPCLDAYRDGEDCSTSCYNILVDADCCFVSYYAFMIDTFVDNDGVPVFENHTMFVDEFWGWCNLTSPGICPGISLDDNTHRNDNISCTLAATTDNTTAATEKPTQTDSADSNAPSKPIAFYLTILFPLLIIFMYSPLC